uniref:Uncharacterized protein n=1 Tax=Panagrolaimus davidi TaxID=227884 RepID=A0A914Q2P8_9BILA
MNISSPGLSLLETLYYGSLEPYVPDADDNVYIYSLQNIAVQFTVLDYDISKNGTLGFKDASGNLSILTGVNKTLEFFSTTVTLYYSEPNYGHKGARIYLKAFYKSAI